MNRIAAIAFVLPILLPVSPVRANEPAELLRFVPHSANTVGVVRVSEILKTPLARHERWADRRHALLGGAAQIPPWADFVVLAAQVHPTIPEEIWTVALMPMRDGVDLETIAWHEDATVQELAGFASVRSRRGAYLLQLDANVLAVRTPGVRQQTAHWLRTVAAEGPAASEYLREAAASASHILLALDMTDALDPDLMGQRLDELPELKDQHVKHDQLLKLIVGLRGIRFTATISESIDAQVVLDLPETPSDADTQHLRTLFLTVLGDLQVELDELAQANVSVEGRSLVLSTKLSGPSLRRVMSLLISPTSLESTSREATIDRTSRIRNEPTEDQTARYFSSVTGIVDDLQRVNRKATDYLRTATWHDNFAKRIDQLSIAGVESSVVEFGAETASRLRALAASLRGDAVEVDTQSRSVTYDMQVQPGWAAWNVWGGYGYHPGSWRVTSNLKRSAGAYRAGGRDRSTSTRAGLVSHHRRTADHDSQIVGEVRAGLWETPPSLLKTITRLDGQVSHAVTGCDGSPADGCPGCGY